MCQSIMAQQNINNNDASVSSVSVPATQDRSQITSVEEMSCVLDNTHLTPAVDVPLDSTISVLEQNSATSASETIVSATIVDLYGAEPVPVAEVTPSVVEQLAATVDLTGGHTAIPRRKAGGRKRPAEKQLNPQAMQKVLKSLKVTMGKSHGKSTIKNYQSYVRAINKWYTINHVLMMDFSKIPPEINIPKFRHVVQTKEGLEEEFKIFSCFIKTREHHIFKDPETGDPARALIGTLSSYRSAFNWYVFYAQRVALPPLWVQHCKGLWVCLKKEEAERKQKGHIPMETGQNKLCVRLYHALAKHFIQVMEHSSQ